MGLSEYERMVLRRLDSDLGRRDPRLRRQLTEFAVPEEPAPSWRPPRAAVAVAAVILAGMTFMVAMVTMLMRQPCPVATTGAQSATGTPVPARSAHAPGRPPGPPAGDTGGRTPVPQTARPSTPTTC